MLATAFSKNVNSYHFQNVLSHILFLSVEFNDDVNIVRNYNLQYSANYSFQKGNRLQHFKMSTNTISKIVVSYHFQKCEQLAFSENVSRFVHRSVFPYEALAFIKSKVLANMVFKNLNTYRSQTC